MRISDWSSDVCSSDLLSVLAGSIFCVPDFSSAQQTGTITGTVLDGSDEPVDFASATLLALPDSSFVAGAQTESGGKFTLGNILPGRYAIRVSFVGYTEEIVGNIRVKAGETTALGSIVIHLVAENLDVITVE